LPTSACSARGELWLLRGVNHAVRVLSQRDDDICRILTHKVRVLSLPQIAATWFASAAGPLRAARKCVAALQEAGLVTVATLVVHPPVAVPAPLVTWSPGDAEPNLGSLAYRLERRWPLAPVPTSLVTATRKAAARYGGHGGRQSRRSEASHDLSLAGLYLHMRMRSSLRAQAWVSEAALLAEGWGRRQPLPDALLRFARGRQIAVEFAGTYPKHRLKRFHAFCARRGLTYEVW
jgi:hypothetical protein